MSITCSQTANGRQSYTASPAVMRPAAHNTAIAARAAVVIIERRELIRDCLARALRASGGDVIALASLGEWLSICDHTHASLVVLSYSGAAEIAQLGQQMQRLSHVKRPAPIVVLSDDEDLTQVLGALNKGAKGYIPTNLPLDVAVEAIRLVRAGGVFVPAGCLSASQRQGKQGASSHPKRIFTARQAAVVDGIRKGKANKMIAYELNLRESTVKVHIRNIMKKLNAKNRTEVAYIATNLENTGGL